MAKPKTLRVVPQRHNGKAWVQCEPHRASMWVVCWMQGSKVKSLVARYSTKYMAEQVMSSEHTRSLGPLRRYRLGGRMSELNRDFIHQRDESLEADERFLRSM